jgi:hypothetical protein
MPSIRRPVARARGVVLAGVAGMGIGLTALAAAPRGATAQESALGVEARGGFVVPVGTFSEGPRPAEGAGPAPSFGVDFALAGGGHWTPYVGFSQHRFACEDAGCASGGQYVATGFRAGLRLVPLPGRGVLPWLALGALTTHVEAGDLGPANAGLSDLGFGGEVGLGIHVGGGSRVALVPGARLAAANVRLPDRTLLRMRYVVADLAVVLSF